MDGGPLFIYVNDAVTYTTQWLQTGLMYDIAKKLNGALITSDHRYFRSNLPTEYVDFSLSCNITHIDESNIEFQ